MCQIHWYTQFISASAFLKNTTLCLITGNSFFQSKMFLYFTKVVAAINVFNAHIYLRCIVILKEHWQRLSDTGINSGGHLQWSCISRGNVFLWNKHLQSSLFFFSIWVFSHEHSRFTRQQGKGEAISLSPLYHFHPLHRHLDISWAITAESSPLHIASSQTRTGNLWFLSTCR